MEIIHTYILIGGSSFFLFWCRPTYTVSSKVNFKRSYFKYYDSFHRIKIKKVWTLQDAHKIKDNGKYMLTQKTHNLTNAQIQNLFTNKEEILQWITELDIDKTA